MTEQEAGVLILQQTYYGMTYVESAITRAWLTAHAREWYSIEFNVRLGAGEKLDASFDDATRRQAELVTQKRADVIARRPGEVQIIEVKVRIALPAIGQLIGYRHLWLDDPARERNVTLKAIGRAITTDVEPVMRAQGIEVELFPRVPVEEP